MLVIDKPNLRINNREKIICGYLLWRPTNPQKSRVLNVFEIFSPKRGLSTKVAYANWYL